MKQVVIRGLAVLAVATLILLLFEPLLHSANEEEFQAVEESIVTLENQASLLVKECMLLDSMQIQNRELDITGDTAMLKSKLASIVEEREVLRVQITKLNRTTASLSYTLLVTIVLLGWLPAEMTLSKYRGMKESL